MEMEMNSMHAHVNEVLIIMIIITLKIADITKTELITCLIYYTLHFH